MGEDVIELVNEGQGMWVRLTGVRLRVRVTGGYEGDGVNEGDVYVGSG